MTGIKTQFLNEMQRMFCGVMTLAITNKVDTMDPAFVSRMEGRLFIKLPGPNEKIQLLSNILKGNLSSKVAKKKHESILMSSYLVIGINMQSLRSLKLKNIRLVSLLE